jgi:hypothetical protein
MVRIFPYIPYSIGDVMEDKPVVAYEVDEYPEYEDEPRRRITAGPIIAIIVVVIILIAFGFYLFYGTGVEEVRILGVDEVFGSDNQYQGIEIRLLAISGGAQRIDGDGTLDIIYKGDNVFSRSVSVSSDEAKVRVDYTDFVMENGVYEIKFSMDGASDKLDDDYFVRHVPHALEVGFSEVLDPETEDVKPMVLITTKVDVPEGGRAFLIKDYNKHYMLKLTVTDPFGETTDMSKVMYEWHQNKSTLQIDLGWEYMGNYSVSAEFENMLVKPESPYKDLTSDPEEVTTFVNKAPFLGDIGHSPNIVRRNNQMTLTVRASDRDLNGGIQYFLIDWGDSDDPSESIEVVWID